MSFDPDDHFFKCSYRCTAADFALWQGWTENLPARPPTMPYHSGPDFVNKARMALAITGARNVLEIGFNLGHSAAVWKALGVPRLVSMDTATDKPLSDAVATIAGRYGFPGFTFLRSSSRIVIREQLPDAIDLIFIDGDHSFEWVCSDIELGMRLGVKWFLLDDFDLHHGPGVQPAIAKFNLMPVALFPNVALCVRGDGWEKRF